jgi:hypothetical protein
MFRSLLPFLFVIFSLAAHAQTTDPAPASALPALAEPQLSAGRQDTLRAVGKLYAKRRLGGKIWLGVAGGGLLAVVRAAANPTTTTVNGVRTSTETNGSAIATVAGLFVGFPALVGIKKLVSFSEANQTVVEEAYRSGRPLPRKISRRLSKQYFN